MILSLSFSSCKDRANPNTSPRHRSTPFVDPVDKPDGKKMSFDSSAVPSTTSSSSGHDTECSFCLLHEHEDRIHSNRAGFIRRHA